MNPAFGGIIYFTEDPKKACFLNDLKENKYNPKGSFNLCKVLPMGSPQAIPTINQPPRPSATHPSKGGETLVYTNSFNT